MGWMPSGAYIMVNTDLRRTALFGLTFMRSSPQQIVLCVDFNWKPCVCVCVRATELDLSIGPYNIVCCVSIIISALFRKESWIG